MFRPINFFKAMGAWNKGQLQYLREAWQRKRLRITVAENLFRLGRKGLLMRPSRLLKVNLKRVKEICAHSFKHVVAGNNICTCGPTTSMMDRPVPKRRAVYDGGWSKTNKIWEVMQTALPGANNAKITMNPRRAVVAQVTSTNLGRWPLSWKPCQRSRKRFQKSSCEPWSFYHRQ